MHFFKVPTLRNVAITGPYFHDGHEESLEDAVRTMAYVQLGEELTDDQAADITAFLHTLTGELPEDARMAAAGDSAEGGGDEAADEGGEEAEEGGEEAEEG
jgi:cytochrome c peroxidase